MYPGWTSYLPEAWIQIASSWKKAALECFRSCVEFLNSSGRCCQRNLCYHATWRHFSSSPDILQLVLCSSHAGSLLSRWKYCLLGKWWCLIKAAEWCHIREMKYGSITITDGIRSFSNKIIEAGSKKKKNPKQEPATNSDEHSCVILCSSWEWTVSVISASVSCLPQWNLMPSIKRLFLARHVSRDWTFIVLRVMYSLDRD